VTQPPVMAATQQCAICHLSPLCMPEHLRNAEALQSLQDIIVTRPPRPRGTLLYTVGEARQTLYFLRSGSAKAMVSDEQGVQCVASFFFPTDIIGASSLVHSVCQESVELLERSAVCEIRASALERLCQGDPGFLHGLLAKVGASFELERAARMRNNHASSDARMADFLLEIGRRMHAIGRCSDDLALSMSRYDIASHLCVAAETVSRGFRRLHDDRLIDVRGKHIKILDPAGLLCRARDEAGRRSSYPLLDRDQRMVAHSAEV